MMIFIKCFCEVNFCTYFRNAKNIEEIWYEYNDRDNLTEYCVKFKDYGSDKEYLIDACLCEDTAIRIMHKTIKKLNNAFKSKTDSSDQ